eukprot:6313357-Pyramimonas_sp.AAC.1
MPTSRVRCIELRSTNWRGGGRRRDGRLRVGRRSRTVSSPSISLFPLGWRLPTPPGLAWATAPVGDTPGGG